MRNYYESNPEGVLFLYFFGVQSVLFFSIFCTFFGRRARGNTVIIFNGISIIPVISYSRGIGLVVADCTYFNLRCTTQSCKEDEAKYHDSKAHIPLKTESRKHVKLRTYLMEGPLLKD